MILLTSKLETPSLEMRKPICPFCEIKGGNFTIRLQHSTWPATLPVSERLSWTQGPQPVCWGRCKFFRLLSSDDTSIDFHLAHHTNITLKADIFDSYHWQTLLQLIPWYLFCVSSIIQKNGSVTYADKMAKVLQSDFTAHLFLLPGIGGFHFYDGIKARCSKALCKKAMPSDCCIHNDASFLI